MAASLAAPEQRSLCRLHILTRWGCWRQVAVDSICLGVHRGERFGLLGPNGAGAGFSKASALGSMRTH